MFLPFTSLVFALAKTVSSLMDEGTVGSIKLQCSWKKRPSCTVEPLLAATPEEQPTSL